MKIYNIVMYTRRNNIVTIADYSAASAAQAIIEVTELHKCPLKKIIVKRWGATCKN